MDSMIEQIYSRRYIIFDRLSKRAVYGKDIDKETLDIGKKYIYMLMTK